MNCGFRLKPVKVRNTQDPSVCHFFCLKSQVVFWVLVSFFGSSRARSYAVSVGQCIVFGVRCLGRTTGLLEVSLFPQWNIPIFYVSKFPNGQITCTRVVY